MLLDTECEGRSAACRYMRGRTLWYKGRIPARYTVDIRGGFQIAFIITKSLFLILEKSQVLTLSPIFKA